jgi:uncharacterized protein YecE (DUF72 family)
LNNEYKIPRYHIGTAGWSYKDWVPAFYLKSQSGSFDWLRFYSHYFNCVEVNASYYTYISPKTVKGWIEKVSDSDDFLFTIKLHQDFTHKRDFDEEKIRSVTYNLEMLHKGGRLGGLLIQFPYSFSYNEPSLDYIRELKEIFGDHNCFVEVRHSSWNKKNVYEHFRQLNLTLCTIDQPQIGKAIQFEPVITNDTAYIRFHGRNTESWMQSIKNFGKEQTYEEQSARYRYLYSPGELIEIEQKIRSIQEKVKEVYVIMNNHPQGEAVANAFELIHLLEEKEKVDIPSTIIKVYPRLEEIALQYEDPGLKLN